MKFHFSDVMIIYAGRIPPVILLILGTLHMNGHATMPRCQNSAPLVKFQYKQHLSTH
jgi:hypothetical protein